MGEERPPAFSPLFRLELAHGRCVGIALPSGSAAGADVIPEAALAALHAEERRHLAALGPLRRTTWVGGRLALRAALGELSLAPEAPILATARGAPQLPSGVSGSISHKDELAVGLAAARGPAGWCVGIDIEVVAPRRSDLARHVLRPEEQARLAPEGDPRRQTQILAAFSAKEAIYKALDPFVARYVAFDEVAVAHRDDGSAEATLHLRGREGGAAEGPFEVELAWLCRDDVILSTARVRRRP